MDAPVPLWIARLSWLTLPFLAWAGVSAALEGASTGASLTVALAGWALWAAVLVGSAVVRPVALVVLRLLMPLAPAVTAVALLLAAGDDAIQPGDADTLRAVIGFVVGIVAVSAVMLPAVGHYFLNGDSYGDERRFGLRCPGPLVVTLGPLWLLGAGLPVAGVALLAAQRWLIGAAAVIVGALAAAWLWAVVSRLVRRFVVFVPAGLTLVDPLSLADPVLLARNRTVSVGPASALPADSDDPASAGNSTARVDLSGGALGLAIELRTDSPTQVVTLSRPGEPGGTHDQDSDQQTDRRQGLVDRVKQARMGVPREAGSVLFTPSRPAEFLLDTRRVGFPQG